MSSPCKASGYLPGKRGHTGYLELLVLNHRQIGSAGDLGQLRSMVCNMTELDLAHNCLGDWAQVSKAFTTFYKCFCTLDLDPIWRLFSVTLPFVSGIVFASRNF